MSHCISVYIFKDNDVHVKDKVTLPHGYAMVWADESILQDLLKQCTVLVHADTDYFGGAGNQSARVISTSTNKECDSIDEALIQIGVIKEKGLDEFDTICLGRYRDHGDFTEEIKEEIKENTGIKPLVITPDQHKALMKLVKKYFPNVSVKFSDGYFDIIHTESIYSPGFNPEKIRIHWYEFCDRVLFEAIGHRICDVLGHLDALTEDEWLEHKKGVIDFLVKLDGRVPE